MNIWKIASRWSETGTHESSILDIFIKNGIAFILPEGNDLSAIQIDDLIAITDGQMIVAVAKAACVARKISQMPGVHISQGDQDRISGCYAEIEGVKIRYYPATLLEKNAFIPYTPIKRFCRVKDPATIERVSSVWHCAEAKSDGNPFKIEARTATLKDLLSDPLTRLYMIPIFQRPYSWGELEVERFVRDVLSAYRKQECMFIGTMQFSAKRILSTRGTSFREVIDGQQRLTTCALILKCLRLLLPESKALRDLVGEFSWIESKVSGGEQQRAMDAALHAESLHQPSENGLNRFVDNGHQILSTLIAANAAPDANDSSEDTSAPLNLDCFASHFATQLQMVIIETDAGLSRTIQIFNVINTTGLDLNGGDLFKVRAFEYFTDVHRLPDTCFSEISALYETLERTNATHGRVVTTIQEILGVYQKILIGRHGLPNALTRVSTETFYERLFDSLLKIKAWDGYKNVAPLDRDKNGRRMLHLDDLNQLVAFRLRADHDWHTPGAIDWETRLARYLIKWSRYSSYWVLPLVVDYCYAEEISADRRLRNDFVQALAKLCVVYSVINAKQINEIHTFFANLCSKMFDQRDGTQKATLQVIIQTIHTKFAERRQAFESELSGHLAAYATAKNLVCRLLEALHAPSIDGLETIFSGGYDIEHIQAYNDQDLNQREEIWQTWGTVLNSIGNLMLLEFDVNRSISNKPFSFKRVHYQQSCFGIAREVASSPGGEWTVSSARRKLAQDTQNLSQFLFCTESPSL